MSLKAYVCMCSHKINCFIKVSTRRNFRKDFLYSFLPFIPLNAIEDLTSVDKIKPKPKEEANTAWTRLKQMYTITELGTLSPQLFLAHNLSLKWLLIVFATKGLTNSRREILEYISANKASRFLTPMHARQVLLDVSLKSLFRNGAKYSIYWSFVVYFGLLAMGTSCTIRNKISFVDFSIGGGAMGAIIKFWRGPKPMFAGTIQGLMLGAYAGCLISFILKKFDWTFENILAYNDRSIASYDWKRMKTYDDARYNRFEADGSKYKVSMKPEKDLDRVE